MTIRCSMTDCVNYDKNTCTCKLEHIDIDMGLWDNNPCCMNYQIEGYKSVGEYAYSNERLDPYASPYCK